MEKIGKVAIVSLIIGIGGLFFDLFACIIAITNMKQIGNTVGWQNLVSYITIGSCGFLGISVIFGIIYAICKSLEKE